jgi:hypothetical protein
MGVLLNDWSVKKMRQECTKNTSKVHQGMFFLTFEMPRAVQFSIQEDNCILEWLAIPAHHLSSKYATMKALTEYLLEQEVSPVT